jgi:tryptophan-rich sensory protein
LQKDFEKNFQKLCKTKQVVQAWSKISNKKKAIHAYLVEIIIGFITSNLCTYLMQTSSIFALVYLLWFVLASITKRGRLKGK